MITANFKGLEYQGKNLIEVIWELSKEFDLLFIGITDPEYLDFCYRPHEFDVKEWNYNLFKIKWEQKNWAALSETAGKIDYSKLENLLEDLVDEHTKLADELIDESFREGYKECQSDFAYKYFYVILEDTGEESFAHEEAFVSWNKVYAEIKRLEEEIPTSSFTSYSVRVEL